MWIVLRVKLPTSPSPPKLSIFWSIPWPNKEIAQEQENRCKGRREEAPLMKGADRYFGLWGSEPNFEAARAIYYLKEKLRVFPHEYAEIKSFEERKEAYDWQPDTDMEKEFLGRRLYKGRRGVFDAALVDGCDEFQAMTTALGGNPVDENMPPPIGWWKCKKEYASIFCDEYEMAG